MSGVIQSILYVIAVGEFFPLLLRKEKIRNGLCGQPGSFCFFTGWPLWSAPRTVGRTFWEICWESISCFTFCMFTDGRLLFLRRYGFFSLSGAVENVLGLAIIWLRGSIDPSVRLYGAVSNIIFWFITKFLELTVRKPLADNGRKANIDNSCGSGVGEHLFCYPVL